MGEVIPINHGTHDESIDPGDQSDSEIMHLFLSQATHPAFSKMATEDFARWVTRQIGDRQLDDLTQKELAWRKRYDQLLVDTDGLDDAALDALLAGDPILAEMYDWLRRTRAEAERRHEERLAILALRGLRSAVDLRPELDALRHDDRWGVVVHMLETDHESDESSP